MFVCKRPSVQPVEYGSVSLPQLARLPVEQRPVDLATGELGVDAAMRPRRNIYYEFTPGTMEASLGQDLFTDLYWPHRRHRSYQDPPPYVAPKTRSSDRGTGVLDRREQFRLMLRAQRKACHQTLREPY